MNRRAFSSARRLFWLALLLVGTLPRGGIAGDNVVLDSSLGAVSHNARTIVSRTVFYSESRKDTRGEFGT